MVISNVILAKTGIYPVLNVAWILEPAFAGMTSKCEAGGLTTLVKKIMLSASHVFHK